MEKEEKRVFSSQRGITLIALIITIIVLLILAGITISLVVGDNGVLNQSIKSVERTSHGQVQEQVQMELANYEADKRTGETDETSIEYLVRNDYLKEITDGDEKYYVVSSDKTNGANLGKGKDKTTGDVYVVEEVEEDNWSLKYYKESNDNKSETLFNFKASGTEETGEVPNPVVEPKVGDIVNYAPSGSYEWDKALASSKETGKETLKSAEGESYNITKWKILSYDSETGMIEMVPIEPVGKLKLQGAQGYNNAVYLLNNACKSLYGDETKGIEARSIKREDFEKAGGEKWKTLVEKVCSDHPFGEQICEYTQNQNYPIIYEKEEKSVIDGKKNESLEALKQSEQIEPIDANSNEATAGYKSAISINPCRSMCPIRDLPGINDALGDVSSLLVHTNGYWIATRGINVGSEGKYCVFTIDCFNSQGYQSGVSFYSDDPGYGPNSSYGLFPVVTLNSNLLTNGENPGEYKIK